MKQIIKAHSGGPTVIGGDAIEFFINDEPAFELLDGLADGGNLYDWTQCSDVLSNGDVLEFTHNKEVYRVYMYSAWPVQIAGPRLKELHTFCDASWIIDPEHLKVAPDNIAELVEHKYLSYNKGDDNE